jgi:hypothetical protein
MVGTLRTFLADIVDNQSRHTRNPNVLLAAKAAEIQRMIGYL